MPKEAWQTFNGKMFHYIGGLDRGLHVFTVNDKGVETGTVVNIDGNTILFIKDLVRQYGEIKMGACRDNPSRNSIGEKLSHLNKSPQLSSYVLPLLEREGYLTHLVKNNAIWVKHIR